ncbi:hypothetical protein F511_18793 [Dorcoceras hygrometricum]|uniref:Uncharacterized protein n=1 Tax=Dorcoceras hygrometricum TaxID=472368 RepID=A0A2Z7AKY7_9LAMI|nr:hypothetical protein F511_18793 [Dorcoceras hygrometricum]
MAKGQGANARSSAAAVDSTEPKMDIKSILKDIEFLESSHMTWKQKKDLENRKVVSLGGKPPKKHRLPLSVARVAMKKQKEREEKMLEESAILRRFGVYTSSSSTKKTVERRRPEERVFKTTEGYFKNGVLDVNHLLQRSTPRVNDGDIKHAIGKGKKKKGGQKGKRKGKGGAVLNRKALQSCQSLDSNVYRCILPQIQFFNFEVAPVLDLQVTPTSEDCIVEMLSCKFEGSEVMERHNERFSAFMRNHIKWETIDARPFLDFDVKLNLVLEESCVVTDDTCVTKIYTQPFTMLPVSAVEGPGNLYVTNRLHQLKFIFLASLRKQVRNFSSSTFHPEYPLKNLKYFLYLSTSSFYFYPPRLIYVR